MTPDRTRRRDWVLSQLAQSPTSETPSPGTSDEEENERRFAESAAYDAATYKPTFVHDILMLPGTLAQLVGKASSEDLLTKMTPALLHGVHAHINLESMQPVLVTARPEDYVQGMIVFGLRKHARDAVRRHYHPFAHRHRVQVEFEVCVSTNPRDRSSAAHLWHIERRAITAYAWVINELDECELATKNESCPNWQLEDYLAGRLSVREPMRVEPSGKGDEADDGYIGRDIVEYESEPEEVVREVKYSDPANLHDQRAPYEIVW
ncbi:hypothetical protein SMMN14_01978 [Sphaerulina musiva]